MLENYRLFQSKKNNKIEKTLICYILNSTLHRLRENAILKKVKRWQNSNNSEKNTNPDNPCDKEVK